MLVIERFYNPVILVSLSSYQTPVTVGGICERRATCRGEKAATEEKSRIFAVVAWTSFRDSLLLRPFVFRMAEASAKRVTCDEPQGTMGRVLTAGEATSRLLSPSRLPLRAHFHQKRDVWVRGRFREETSGGVSRCRQGFLRLGCNRSWKVLRSTEKDIFTNCKFKLTMMGSHTF